MYKKILHTVMVLAASLFLIMVPVQASAGQAQIKVPEKIIKLSEQIGKEYNICPELLQAMAFKESTFRPKAENGTCIGLMQINEPFHRERMDKLGINDLYDPKQNMIMAADYLIELFEKHEDIGIVLMVYNGSKNPEEYVTRTGKLSDYAEQVLELSAVLEEQHGK